MTFKPNTPNNPFDFHPIIYMTFYKFAVIVELCHIVKEKIEYEETTYLYKNKEKIFVNRFEIKVSSLNDLFFENIVIFLKQKRTWFKSQTNLGYIRINLTNFENESSFTGNFNIYNPDSWNNTDFFYKKEEKIGEIILNINIIKFHEPLKSMQNTSKITMYINNVLQSELSTVFAEIKNVADILFQGGISALLKNIVGFFITDKSFHSYKDCTHILDHSLQDCLIPSCFEGYDDIPYEQAKEDIKAARYALASYLDSFLLHKLIKFGPEKFPHVKNSKIKAALERAEDIAEENFIKYFEGDKHTVGFAFFIDSDTLVISLRGTLSHNDIMADINCGYDQFLNGYAHSGILKLTRKFLDRELNTIREIMIQKNLKNILLTGHSLGAAIASMLYIMMQDFEDFRFYKIKARAFSAPPTVSKEIITTFEKSNIINYNYGKDIVPRLSVGTLLEFKYICISIASLPDLNLNFLRSNPTKEEEIRSKVDEIKNFLRESEKFPKLFHPGRIYHIKSHKINDEKIYKFKKVQPRFFADLIFFKDISFDHIIKNQIDAFNYIKSKFEEEKNSNLF